MSAECSILLSEGKTVFRLYFLNQITAIENLQISKLTKIKSSAKITFMLILIYGEDFTKKIKETKIILDSLKRKKKDALFLHFDYLEINSEKLAELTQARGLFEQKNIILLSNIFKNNEVKKFFLDNLEIFKNSDNAFILTEDIITPAVLTKIEKYTFKTYNFPLKKENINIFNLSNFLQNKDKKKLWIFYHSSLKDNITPEEFFGVLIWSLKTLALTEKFSEKESGIKYFPYQKAKSALKKWSALEIEQKIFQAIQLFNQSRTSGPSLKNSLEKFILGL